MRYEGMIYRPPSEAYSYLLQVTIGCAHNKCTFCNMFRAKQFRVRPLEDIMVDIDLARKAYRHVEKIFLCDGDALCLSMGKLLPILDRIEKVFPECKRVTMYGAPKDVLRKTELELRALKAAGVKMIYIGAESGSEEVLKRIQKGATRAEIIEAVRKLEDAGLQASVTFISGLGGRELWQEHAVETGTMISAMEPSYVGLLTLMLEEGAPILDEIKAGTFKLLTPEQAVTETLLMLENIEVKRNCVFRSNHASNYLSLRGTLPGDQERLIAQTKRAIEDTSRLKDERFRLL